MNRNENLPSARIMSQARKGTACLSFRSLVFQQTSLSLSVKVRFETSPGAKKREETIISYNGNQGGNWFDVEQTVYMPQSFSYQVSPVEDQKLTALLMIRPSAPLGQFGPSHGLFGD